MIIHEKAINQDMSEITTRQQWKKIPETDLVLIVKKSLSKSRKHYAKCGHLHTDLMKQINFKGRKPKYYHYKKDEEIKEEKHKRVKWCNNCEKIKKSV